MAEERRLADALGQGYFSVEEATALRTVLMAGALPAPLHFEREESVPPFRGPVFTGAGVAAIGACLAAAVVFVVLFVRSLFAPAAAVGRTSGSSDMGYSASHKP